MAASSRRADTAVDEALFERGYQFDFFQAVRLMARLQPDRKAVGGLARPSEEIVRFSALVSLTFPASAIYNIEQDEDSGPARMTVTFMGLTGTQGILPLCYTERMVASKAAKTRAHADFFDIFNHRFLSLFYAAWQKHRPVVLYESAALRQHHPDLFTQCLFDLIGMGTAGLRDRMRIPDESLLVYAGLMTQRPRSASAIRGILRDYFSLSVQIDQFLGSWYELNEADRCYLAPDSQRNQLGVGAFLGDRVWDQQSRFRIRLEALSMAQFKNFLPESNGIAELRELARFLVGPQMAYDVQLYLRASEVPKLILTDEGFEAPQLGWTSWLKIEEFRADAGDAVFAYLT